MFAVSVADVTGLASLCLARPPLRSVGVAPPVVVGAPVA